jgi:hypothetical protein
MLKKILESGAFYIFVAILFMASAAGKTISESPSVILMQWGCALIFVFLGFARLIKSVTPKTRFKRLDEFYQAVDDLIARLNAEGYSADAQKLDELLHGTAWTINSELLGELMLALKSMQGKYSRGLEKEIRECREFAIHHRHILGLDGQ